MKRPTITKKQAIAAMIEQINRDYHEAFAEHERKVDEAEAHLHSLVLALINDPVRLSDLMAKTPAPPDTDGEDEIKDEEEKPRMLRENVSLDYSHTSYHSRSRLAISFVIDDPEILAAKAAVEKLRSSWPDRPNESKLEEELDAKLTGCDPQSLLSVPENVATIRALLNGLQLLH